MGYGEVMGKGKERTEKERGDRERREGKVSSQ